MLTFNESISIGGTWVGGDRRTFIIAEAGVNHSGSFAVAKQLVDAAAETGVDAVKFQTFKPERLILRNVEKAPYQMLTTSKRESQFEMLKRLVLDPKHLKELKAYTEAKGLVFLSTPFDDESLDILDDLNIAAFKIASTDITNIPYLKRVAAKGKPILLSTGMAYMPEVDRAVAAIYQMDRDLILLQCTANYPIADRDANLRVIETFKNSYNVLIGYSDHTVGIGAAPYAVAMGAKVIEKHFTLDRKAEGPDHLASVEPAEMRHLVETVRKVETMLGTGQKLPTLVEQGTRQSLTKFLVAKVRISKGDLLTDENVTAKRTGGKGISPIYWDEIAGSPAPKDFDVDDIIAL